MANQKQVSLSPAQINDQLQVIMNKTAMAENYLLESETIKTYNLITQIEQSLPTKGNGLSNYYLLFNAWIRWLSDWKNYSLNLLHRRRLLGHLNRQFGTGKFSLQIYPYATRLYSFKMLNGKPEIQLHESLDYMNENECRQFAQYVKQHRWNDLRHLVRIYQENNTQWKELSLYFQKTKTNPAHENNTRGRYYDLEDIFTNCNSRNFGGKIPRPKVIHWSPRVNHSTMGSYNINEDILMINRGLDRRDVPAYVLDFVMYHELLHKVFGVKTNGTRRMAHTKEFRDIEQKHPEYEKAQAFIQKNAKKL